MIKHLTINSKRYWDEKFAKGGVWEHTDGYSQTRQFAESQMRFFSIPKTFTGTICDFGCGPGDAFPIYKSAWPSAQLMGVDFSESAIALGKQRFGSIAQFMVGNESDVPKVDVIISSNTFEHLDNDKEIARILLEKCDDLYIIVPFREKLNPDIVGEHVNRYELDTFDFLGAVEKRIFRSRGWGPHGWRLLYHIHLKNLVRPFLGKTPVAGDRQIMYHIRRH